MRNNCNPYFAPPSAPPSSSPKAPPSVALCFPPNVPASVPLSVPPSGSSSVTPRVPPSATPSAPEGRGCLAGNNVVMDEGQMPVAYTVTGQLLTVSSYPGLRTGRRLTTSGNPVSGDGPIINDLWGSWIFNWQCWQCWLIGCWRWHWSANCAAGNLYGFEWNPSRTISMDKMPEKQKVGGAWPLL